MKKLFLLVLAATLFVAATCPLPTTQPKTVQDYAITDSVECSGGTFYLNGVLTVQQDGSLNFHDATLKIAGATAEHGIDVYGTASFNNAVVTSTTEAVDETDNYFFTVREGADFSFENGEIKHCGADYDEPETRFGLKVLADDAVISNTDFSNNYQNLNLECNGAQITGNAFHSGSQELVRPIILSGLNIAFNDNEVEELFYRGSVIRVFDSENTVFSDNNITSQSGDGVALENVNNSAFTDGSITSGTYYRPEFTAIRLDASESNTVNIDNLTGVVDVSSESGETRNNVVDLTVSGGSIKFDPEHITLATTVKGVVYADIEWGLSEGNVLEACTFEPGESYEFGADESINAIKDSTFQNTKGIAIDVTTGAQAGAAFEFTGNTLNFPDATSPGGGATQDDDGLNALLTITGSNIILKENDLDAGEGTAYYFKNANNAQATAGQTTAKPLHSRQYGSGY